MKSGSIYHFSSTHPSLQEAFLGPSLVVRPPTLSHCFVHASGWLEGLHRHVYLQSQAGTGPAARSLSERATLDGLSDGWRIHTSLHSKANRTVGCNPTVSLTVRFMRAWGQQSAHNFLLTLRGGRS